MDVPSITSFYFFVVQSRKVCDKLTHPVGTAEAHARELGSSTKLLLNTKELVVLGGTLTTAGGAGLDLAGAETDSEVRDVVVLSLTGTVGSHNTPSVLLGELHSTTQHCNRRRNTAL